MQRQRIKKEKICGKQERKLRLNVPLSKAEGQHCRNCEAEWNQQRQENLFAFTHFGVLACKANEQDIGANVKQDEPERYQDNEQAQLGFAIQSLAQQVQEAVVEKEDKDEIGQQTKGDLCHEFPMLFNLCDVLFVLRRFTYLLLVVLVLQLPGSALTEHFEEKFVGVDQDERTHAEGRDCRVAYHLVGEVNLDEKS